jgi:hypothetical protein
MRINRRDLLKSFSILTSMLTFNEIFFGLNLVYSSEKNIGNFQYIYNNPKLKNEFLLFLKNVFHLYPEADFHVLISEITKSKVSDKDIYKELLRKINSIKPFLSEINYSLPALKLQKEVMTKQTLNLLSNIKEVNGYMELGTTGRYVGELNNYIDIKGDIYLMHTSAASYGPIDILERGQFSKIGKYIDMGDYSFEFSNVITKNSLSVVSVYIGFHHCPLDKRLEYISKIRDTLKVGGKLILRDHDCHNEDMFRMAGLAHDVFNAGTKETLQTNTNELRNFYSLDYIIKFIEKIGFSFDGKKLFQAGDPTKNALMSFTKV